MYDELILWSDDATGALFIVTGSLLREGVSVNMDHPIEKPVDEVSSGYGNQTYDIMCNNQH